MAKMDPNNTLAFGFLLGALTPIIKVKGFKFPDAEVDLNQTPFEITLIDRDGNEIHLKISDISLKLKPETENK